MYHPYQGFYPVTIPLEDVCYYLDAEQQDQRMGEHVKDSYTLWLRLRPLIEQVPDHHLKQILHMLEQMLIAHIKTPLDPKAAAAAKKTLYQAARPSIQAKG
jgi:hypothetical protein